MPLRGGINLPKELDPQMHVKSEPVGHRGVLDTDVFAEEPASGAADELDGPFDGVLPTRGIDGSIVDDADQIAELLSIMEIAWRGQCRDRSQM